MFNLINDWKKILEGEFEKEYYISLIQKLQEEYDKYEIYPPKKDVFNALNLSSYKDTKVVIIGQDPYHEPNQAHGLAFSVRRGTKLPPSLINIYKELKNEFGYEISDSGDLTPWAKQGVLLLNNVLTVRRGIADSHKKIGWELLTNRIIEVLNEKDSPVVFIFWGNNAKKKMELVTNPKHLILHSPHPSPLSCHHGFFNNNHFIKANEFLKANGEEEICWKIPTNNICLF